MLLLNKAQVRQEISLLKISNKNKRNKNLIENLEKLNYKIILGFIPIKSEPDILPFLVSKYNSGFIVGIPAIVGNEMIFKTWNNKFRKGKFGLLEADTDQLVNFIQPDILCITPLVACTVTGDRLGRGGGFYDRFFAKHYKIFKVGVCYKEQVLSKIPTKSHDIKLDKVIYV